MSPIDGDRQKVKQFFMNNGIIGSYLEGGIFEQIFGGEAVSTIHILNKANQEGIKVYQINSANAADVLPKLQYNTLKKQSLQNLIDSGKEITIPEKKVTISGWNGTGYIVLDPEDGTGAYMIDGGLSGGLINIMIINIALFITAMAFCIVGSSLALPMTAAWLISTLAMPLFVGISDKTETIVMTIVGIIFEIAGLILPVLGATLSIASLAIIADILAIVGIYLTIYYGIKTIIEALSNDMAYREKSLNESKFIC